MNPGQRGAIAEAAIAFEAIRLHVGVFRPLTESRYDLIFDTGSRLLRVQCKSAVRHGDVVIIRCGSCRRGRDGYVRRAYTRDEVDVVAAYCHDTGVSYLLQPDVFEGHSALAFRLARPRITSAWASTGLPISSSGLHFGSLGP
jgi:hypothetical protein